MELKEKLIEFRAKNGFTQEQAAKVLETTREMVNALENKRHEPSLFKCKRIEYLMENYKGGECVAR